MNLRTKIILVVLVAPIIAFGLIIGFISIVSKRSALEDAYEITNTHTREFALKIQDELNRDFSFSRGLAYAFAGGLQAPDPLRTDVFNQTLLASYQANPQYLIVWATWELSAVDFNFSAGRVRSTVQTIDEEVVLIQDTVDLYGEDTESLYFKLKTNPGEAITEPYFFSATRRDDDMQLITSVVVPIMDKNVYIGLAGVDVSLQRYSEMLEQLKPYPNSQAFFITDKGYFVSHSDTAFLNKRIDDVLPDYVRQFDVLDSLGTGKGFQHFYVNEKGQQEYVCYQPVYFGNTTEPWYIALSVPVGSLQESVNAQLRFTTLISIISILGMLIAGLVVSGYIIRPLKQIRAFVTSLAKGDIQGVHTFEVTSHDEIGQIQNAFNSLLDGLRRAVKFAQEVGRGNPNATYVALSNRDNLGNALVDMQQNLERTKSENLLRRTDEQRQNWATEGMARFSQIFREYQNDVDEFNYAIISNLVKYLEASIGGIYLLNDDSGDTETIELAAAYAFNRRKVIERTYIPGEGLVGTCVFEKETIYLTDIPTHYITITSGLGEDNPRNLVLVPLKSSEKVYGVIEIASFKVIEPYQVDFLEKVGDAIASAYAALKNSRQMRILLEESKSKSEALARQEETMRQQMEELKATQEEMMKKNKENDENMKMLSKIIDLVPFPVFVKNINYKYTIVNQAQATLFGKRAETMLGKGDDDFVNDPEELRVIRESDWEVTTNRKKIVLPKQIITLFDGTIRTMQTTKVPFINNVTRNVNILGVSIDYTDILRAEDEIRKQEAVLEEHLAFYDQLFDHFVYPVFYKDVNGVYQGCNHAFAQYIGHAKEDVIGKTNYELRDHETARSLEIMDREILQLRRGRMFKRELPQPDGSSHEVYIYKTVYFKPDCSIGGVVGIITDITGMLKEVDNQG